MDNDLNSIESHSLYIYIHIDKFAKEFKQN